MLFGNNGIIHKMISNYFSLGIARSAAELSYFLLFSFCPILMFLTAVLAQINLSDETIYNFIKFLPSSVQITIEGYIHYLSTQPTIKPMLAGTILTLYFLSRAVRSMMYTIQDIYGFDGKNSAIQKWIMSFIFTCGFLLSIIGTLALIVFSKSALLFLEKWFQVPHYLTNAIENISMYVAFTIIFIFVILVNKLIPQKKLKFINILPGAFFSFIAWFFISSAFSFYVNNISNYSLLYGSLGAIIILMIWLYMTSITLLLGPLLNKILLDIKK